MSERKIGGVDTTPITEYWQYKAPEKAGKGTDKVRVLETGNQFKGAYIHTFIDKDMEADDGTFPETHLLKLEDGRKVTVKGAKGLNRDLALLEKGDNVRLVFNGKGKAKKKGRRPPYLWDVFLITPDKQEVPASEETDTAPDGTVLELEANEIENDEETLSEEVPF